MDDEFLKKQKKVDELFLEMMALQQQLLYAVLTSLPRQQQEAIRQHEKFAPFMRLNADIDKLRDDIRKL